MRKSTSVTLADGRGNACQWIRCGKAERPSRVEVTVNGVAAFRWPIAPGWPGEHAATPRAVVVRIAASPASARSDGEYMCDRFLRSTLDLDESQRPVREGEDQADVECAAVNREGHRRGARRLVANGVAASRYGGVASCAVDDGDAGAEFVPDIDRVAAHVHHERLR